MVGRELFFISSSLENGVTQLLEGLTGPDWAHSKADVDVELKKVSQQK